MRKHTRWQKVCRLVCVYVCRSSRGHIQLIPVSCHINLFEYEQGIFIFTLSLLIWTWLTVEGRRSIHRRLLAPFLFLQKKTPLVTFYVSRVFMWTLKKIDKKKWFAVTHGLNFYNLAVAFELLTVQTNVLWEISHLLPLMFLFTSNSKSD